MSPVIINEAQLVNKVNLPDWPLIIVDSILGLKFAKIIDIPTTCRMLKLYIQGFTESLQQNFKTLKQ